MTYLLFCINIAIVAMTASVHFKKSVYINTKRTSSTQVYFKAWKIAQMLKCWSASSNAVN